MCVCGIHILKVSHFSDPELASSAPTVLIRNTTLHTVELCGNGVQSWRDSLTAHQPISCFNTTSSHPQWSWCPPGSFLFSSSSASCTQPAILPLLPNRYCSSPFIWPTLQRSCSFWSEHFQSASCLPDFIWLRGVVAAGYLRVPSKKHCQKLIQYACMERQEFFLHPFFPRLSKTEHQLYLPRNVYFEVYKNVQSSKTTWWSDLGHCHAAGNVIKITHEYKVVGFSLNKALENAVRFGRTSTPIADMLSRGAGQFYLIKVFYSFPSEPKPSHIWGTWAVVNWARRGSRTLERSGGLASPPPQIYRRKFR